MNQITGQNVGEFMEKIALANKGEGFIKPKRFNASAKAPQLSKEENESPDQHKSYSPGTYRPVVPMSGISAEESPYNHQDFNMEYRKHVANPSTSAKTGATQYYAPNYGMSE